jgi:autophagy-related protein 5
MHDLFIHSVKEADYLRTGTGKTVMFLSKEDSTQLWDAVVKHDFALFNPINQKFLNPQGVNLRHLPVRLYLPHAAEDTSKEEPGSLRVVQSLVQANLSSRECFFSLVRGADEKLTEIGQPQTIGTALHQILPSLFPSRRSPLLAQAVLHGAVLPLNANVEELVRAAAYLDGWLHVAVVMMG